MKAKKPDLHQRLHTQGTVVSAGFLLAFASVSTFRANAQIEIHKPFHLSHVQGVVTDRSGKPVANAEVDLVREEAPSFKTKTDDSGRFVIDQASGRYWFRVSESSYSPAAREVIIGADAGTAFHRAELYGMLGPGACSNECSSIYTSKKKFDPAVRWNTRHY